MEGSLNAMSSSTAYEIGRQLHAQGRLEEAELLYWQFLARVPTSAEGQFNLAAVLHLQGRTDEAAERYAKAIELRPEFVEAHNNLGKVFQDRGLLDKAIESYRLALRFKPTCSDAWYNLGTALNDQEEYAEAVECLRKAIETKPDYAEAYVRLGMSLHELARLQEAEPNHQQAVELVANSAARRLFDGAENAYKAAIALSPNCVEAYNNLGSVFHETGGFQEAGVSYRKALALNPGWADIHWHLGILMLLQGDLTNGWREFEWRWKCNPFKSVEFMGPLWDGRDLTGKTILLRAEQGLGDLFQFIRYTKLVKDLGARVVLICPAAIQRLLVTCPGIDEVCRDDEVPPKFDFESPLMSLPGILGTTLETVPADIPYLFADGDLVGKWKLELADIVGFRIGVNWHGRTGRGHFRKRDVPFEMLARLGELPGVNLISLQQGAHEELDQEQRPMVWLPSADFDMVNGAFMDTSAIIMNLDLVITSDTAIAHLAGALGKPVWVLLPYVPDWRWLLERSDTPWYATMRLFRQHAPGEWFDVFEMVEEQLKSLLSVQPRSRSSKV